MVGDMQEIKNLIREHLLEVLQANDRPMPILDAPPR